MESSAENTGSAPLDCEPGAATSLRAGSVVGPWRVEYELGRGGMGTVYAVVHEHIGKRAALKVIHPHMYTPAYTGERFLLEARAVNVVPHPNIVDIFESGTLEDGRPYLVMERLRGKTLGDRVDEGRIPPIEAIDYLLPLCDALAAAHAAGVVHRDIKLDNVFLVDCQAMTSYGGVPGTCVKLLDWGIASVASVDGDVSFRDMLVGTPRYVSPEQARGERPSPSSDIYSLGVVAYELFLESPPFAGDSAAEVLAAHLSEPPPPPRDVWPQIPTALDHLLMDMLAKAPELRPTIAQVAETLRMVRGRLVAQATPSLPLAGVLDQDSARYVKEVLERGPTLVSVERPHRRWLFTGALCVLVALAAGARLVNARASVASVASVASPPAAALVAPPPLLVVPIAPIKAAPVAPITVAPVAPIQAAPTPAPPHRTAWRRHGAARAARDAGRVATAARDTTHRLHPDDTIDPYLMRASALALVLAQIATIPRSWADTSAAPDAEVRARARAESDRGRRHYELGEYERAIEAYRSAYLILPSPGVLFNLGQAQRLRGDCAAAAIAYRSYLRAEPDGPAQRIARTQLAEVEKCAAPTPRPGVAAGDQGRALRGAGLAASVGGGVLLAAGMYFALDARRAAGEVERKYASGGAWSDIAAADARGRRSSDYALALGVGGGAALATGAVLYLIGRHARAETAPPTVWVTSGTSSAHVGISWPW